MIEIYTDGSCEPNPGPGGWAVIVVKDDREVTRLSGRADHTTNNAMELTALVRAANWAAGCPAVIYSDSQYALNCLKWAIPWKSRGWKKADGGAVANVELVKELHAANRPGLKWTWVRGHNGNKWNEEADRLAEQARSGVTTTPPAPTALVEALVSALMASGNVMVIGDGCSTKERDEQLLRRVITRTVADWRT